MHEVQKFLRSGNTIDDLMREYDIEVFYHDRHPLLGFNYGVRSPKFEPITRECRGLILEAETWNLVGKPLYRFFNQGESVKDDARFDWSDFVAYEKIDGSMLVASHYNGEWIVNTRGTFGQFQVGQSGKTWEQLLWETAGFTGRALATGLSYTFELSTPHNVVIRRYEKPKVWLLAIHDSKTGEELSPKFVDREAYMLGIARPEGFRFNPLELVDALTAWEEDDPTFEGYVIQDWKGNRLKVKSKTYVALHAFFDNGNLYLPKRLVPLWLSQDFDEVLLRFPDVKPYLDQIGEVLDQERKKLWDLWMTVKDIETQKEFAQTSLPRTELSSILFDIRKRYFGREVTWREFCDAWRQWPDLFLKKLQWEEVDA